MGIAVCKENDLLETVDKMRKQYFDANGRFCTVEEAVDITNEIRKTLREKELKENSLHEN